MNRLFSIPRRRPHIVDFYTPVVAGVDGYRIKWASNFDGVFATIITSTNIGFLDDNVNRNVIETQPTTGTSVRIVFDPTTYAIPDGNSFWLQFVQVIGGVEQTPGAPTLVLPDSARHGVGMVVIQGGAPAAPLQLDLPMLMQDFRITNEDGAANLFFGTEDGGPMTTIYPLLGVQNIGYLGTQGSIYVQGDGGVVPFSATFTLAFPR
jgi:hypothetical protein